MAKYRTPDNLTNEYLKDRIVRVTESYPAAGARAAYEVVYEGKVYSVENTTITLRGDGRPQDRTAFLRSTTDCVVVVEERVDPLEVLLTQIEELELEDHDLDDVISHTAPSSLVRIYLELLRDYLQDARS